MARRKNVKRIDPRYFLNETVNRNDDGSRLEEGLLDNIKSFVAKRSPGKALAHRIVSNGGGAEGAQVAAADISALAKEEYKNSKSPLLKSLQRAWNDDPSLYRATIAQAVIDDIGEDLTRPPRTSATRGGSDADTLASSIFFALDKPGRQLMLRMWDETDAARDYEGRARDAEYAKEKAARAKNQAMAQRGRSRQLDKWEDDQKAKKRAERDRKQRERDRDFDGGISGKSNWREE